MVIHFFSIIKLYDDQIRLKQNFRALSISEEVYVVQMIKQSKRFIVVHTVLLDVQWFFLSNENQFVEKNLGPLLGDLLSSSYATDENYSMH